MPAQHQKLKSFAVKLTIPGAEGSIVVKVKAPDHKRARMKAEIKHFPNIVTTAQEDDDANS